MVTYLQIRQREFIGEQLSTFDHLSIDRHLKQSKKITLVSKLTGNRMLSYS